VDQGGTGFAPPYLFPNPNAGVAPMEDNGGTSSIIVCDDDAGKHLEMPTSAVNDYLQNFVVRQEPPAVVFCSRELEKGLIDFALERTALTGQMPADEELKARARQILGVQSTAADDEVLLNKFREMVQAKILAMTSAQQAVNDAATAAGSVTATTPSPAADIAALTAMPEMNISNSDLDDILMGMELDLGPATAL
jgi:hypothetical protein